MNPVIGSFHPQLAYLQQGKPIAVSQAANQDNATASGQVLGKVIAKVDAAQHEAENTVQQFALGKQDILAVTMALNKADISLKLAVEVRNKALEAYQEIMRTNI